MAQQTTVDWLYQNLFPKQLDGFSEEEWKKIDTAFEQAKQIDKEQIKSAYNKGYQDGEIDSLDAKDGDVQFFEDAEQYYNETYGKETN